MAFGFFKKKEAASQKQEQDVSNPQSQWDALTKQADDYIAELNRESEKVRRESEEMRAMMGARLMQIARVSQHEMGFVSETAARTAKELSKETSRPTIEITSNAEYDVFSDSQLEANTPRLMAIEEKIKNGGKGLNKDDLTFILTSDDNYRRTGAPSDYDSRYSEGVKDFVARRNELKSWCFNNLKLDGMKYNGDLDLAGIDTLKKLPNNFHVTGEIMLQKTSISELPEGLHAEKVWLDGSNVSSIPASMRVEKTLSLYNTKVQMEQIPRSVKPEKIYSPTEIGVKYDGATREVIR